MRNALVTTWSPGDASGHPITWVVQDLPGPLADVVEDYYVMEYVIGQMTIITYPDRFYTQGSLYAYEP